MGVFFELNFHNSAKLPRIDDRRRNVLEVLDVVGRSTHAIPLFLSLGWDATVPLNAPSSATFPPRPSQFPA
jgi:hypothetical protein